MHPVNTFIRDFAIALQKNPPNNSRQWTACLLQWGKFIHSVSHLYIAHLLDSAASEVSTSSSCDTRPSVCTGVAGLRGKSLFCVPWLNCWKAKQAHQESTNQSETLWLTWVLVFSVANCSDSERAVC